MSKGVRRGHPAKRRAEVLVAVGTELEVTGCPPCTTAATLDACIDVSFY